MHYYKFHIADYKADTAHLTPMEHYIYRSLIDWYYLDESPIPKKTQPVMRRLSLGKNDLVFLENVLSDFFVLDDSGYIHGKIEEELRLYRENASKNQKNGKKGGRPRKSKATANPLETQPKPKITQSVNLDNPNVTQPKGNHKPLTINQEPLTNTEIKTPVQNDLIDGDKPKGKTKPVKRTPPDLFKQLWKEYPRFRAGGRWNTGWNAWVRIGYSDAEINFAYGWLKEAAQILPATWGTNTTEGMAFGFTRFITDKTWATPLPDDGAPACELTGGQPIIENKSLPVENGLALEHG